MQDTASHLQKNLYQKEKIRNKNVVGKRQQSEKEEGEKGEKRRVRMRIRTKEKMDKMDHRKISKR